MNKESIVRAWKDPAYRASLSPEQRTELPEHPSGVAELDDATLGEAVGGGGVLDIARIRIIRFSAVDACPSLFCPFQDVDIRINPQVAAVRF
ncbi:mersacidin/lichenicidin family type 2 lantibiotic [Archangium lansingense]|uniref:Mersacidin/lichenicidin family type 2 lantibiotic n=1 Tax=Archangium lansingense TaxID=2995310 RepID=A0ABT4AK83_9BACT|nr:mersacidin/lichenicidin family type 2 lantibiotic [Archangium lansinium]MCY1081986.1 mersacidin/lichenicidin family type 2 lantibiotic [Archangium lansinium]